LGRSWYMVPIAIIIGVLNPFLGIVAGGLSTVFAHLRGDAWPRNVLAAITLFFLLYVMFALGEGVA
jgi:hypothetical protein